MLPLYLPHLPISSQCYDAEIVLFYPFSARCHDHPKRCRAQSSAFSCYFFRLKRIIFTSMLSLGLTAFKISFCGIHPSLHTTSPLGIIIYNALNWTCLPCNVLAAVCFKSLGSILTLPPNNIVKTCQPHWRFWEGSLRPMGNLTCEFLWQIANTIFHLVQLIFTYSFSNHQSLCYPL